MDPTASSPDFTSVALAGTFDLASLRCRLEISPIRHFADYGPDFDVVHLRVLADDQPLALADLQPDLAPADGYRLWADLCAALQEVTAQAYSLTPPVTGESNPRLGCWGPRADLRALGDSDCATALVLGIAVDTRLARRRPSSLVLARQLAAVILPALRSWAAGPPSTAASPS